MNKLERVNLEPALILHARPWRDTSLLVEAFSHCHGRLGLVARGARRPKSRMRGLLQPFVPLLLSWRGKGELVTLTGVEPEPECSAAPLAGSATLVGFYVNELLLRFLHRHDPEPTLFAHYREALDGIADADNPEPVLRIFEKRLLQAVGYAPELEREAGSGVAIEPEGRYRYTSDSGPERCSSDSCSGVCVSGATLLALARERLTDRRALREAKHLMRWLIDDRSGGRMLASRRLWRR